MEYNSEQVADVIEQARQEAYSGTHEVYLREDGNGPSLDEAGMPVCRFERWSDSGDPSTGIAASSGWQLSKDQTGTLLCLAIAQQETLALIDKLREEEGDSVTIISDNADFNGQPNCLITCMGDWTGWVEIRFTADTVLDCLRAAVEQKERGPMPDPAIQPEPVRIKWIEGCARCGGSHAYLSFFPLTHPCGELTHWSSCPSNGQPILMKIVSSN